MAPKPNAAQQPAQQPQQPVTTKINYQKPSNANIANPYGMSLKNLQDRVNNKAAQQPQNEEVKATQQQQENSPVDENQLMTQWQRFAESVIQSDHYLYSQMISCRPKLDGSTITIEVVSEQTDNISHSQELIDFLRQNLHNSSLSIKAIVNANLADGKELVYTPRQKIDKMIEANPKIMELIKAFSLDLES